LQFSGITEKQNGKNIDFSVQKINFILHEGGKNRNGEDMSQCFNKLHQYSKSHHAFKSQGYSIVLYRVHLESYLGVMEKMLSGFKLTRKCPCTIQYPIIISSPLYLPLF
jgi:hypothetical protein